RTDNGKHRFTIIEAATRTPNPTAAEIAITVPCPSCNIPMEIENNEPDTEWECPACGAAFLVEKNAKGKLRFSITEAATRTPTPAEQSLATGGMPEAPQQDSQRIIGLEGLSDNEIIQELNRGGRFIVYSWCFSALILSFRQNSPIHFIRANES